MNNIWIEENLKLYEGLKENTIYCVFENEPIINREEAGKPIYKTICFGKKKERTSRSQRVSKKGNDFITNISTCECGIKREGVHLRSGICKSCRLNYKHVYKNKTNPQVKSVTSLYFKKKGVERIKRIAENLTGSFNNVDTEKDLSSGWDDINLPDNKFEKFARDGI